MFLRIKYLLLLLSICIYSASTAQETDALIRQLKNEYEIFNNIRSEKVKLSKVSIPNIIQTKQIIFKIKNQLQSVNNELDNPIYFRNDIKLDNNLDLVDFYLYEYSDNYYQAFGRIKNKQQKYLEWVKLRYNLYNNGVFIATDYTYIDFESYGSSGISPYKYSFINTFIDKANFDSITFQIEYDTGYGDDNILWDQILKLESVVINPSGSLIKWQGVVKNNYNYSMTFPCIYACIMKQGRMIALDYTYLDVQNNQLLANSSGVFDSYIDLPDSYDDIKYYINYALYSLDGDGNLPPNTPIFVGDNYSGYSRTNTNFEAFVIDPDRDRINLSIDFGDGYTSTWAGNFLSGYNAIIQYPYSQSGNFIVQAKASDGSLETQWSESINTSITLSSTPIISTTEIENASYKKSYNFQLQSNGGINPVTWQFKNGLLPDGLSLNSNNGSIAGVPLSSGSFEFSVYCTDSGIPAISDSAIFQLQVNNQKPEITSTDTINTFVNTLINYTASATDPDSNAIYYDFLNYPNWLTVTNSSVIGTTPNQISDTSFTLVASDGDLFDTLNVTIAIRTKPLSIISEDICDAYYKNEYNDTLNATGGLSPYSWSIVNGDIAKGLELNALGILSGIADSSGLYKFVVQVKDSDISPKTDTLSFNICVINSNPQITSNDTITIRKNDDFLYTASAIDPENNQLNYLFINIPSWLSVSDSIIYGNVPSTATDTTFKLIVTDGELSDSIKVMIKITEPSSIDASTVPSHFLLSENYPNPFNPITNIKVELPVNTKFEISIYDIAGKLIKELHKGQLNAGSHIFTWDAKEISSGIYFIYFKSNRFNKVIKCTLLK